MAARRETYISPEEYLEQERQAEEKSEYISGEIIAMAGASPSHVEIVWNLSGLLYSALRGKPCRGGSSDQRVKVPETGAYSYPDIVVICGEPRYESGRPETLLNPTVLIEVLSPSTESYDLGLKLAHYRRLESMQEYLAVAQDRVYIQHWTRRPEGGWLVDDIEDPNATVRLESIGCDLRVADIYDRVTFGAEGAAI